MWHGLTVTAESVTWRLSQLSIHKYTHKWKRVLGLFIQRVPLAFIPVSVSLFPPFLSPSSPFPSPFPSPKGMRLFFIFELLLQRNKTP